MLRCILALLFSDQVTKSIGKNGATHEQPHLRKWLFQR